MRGKKGLICGLFRSHGFVKLGFYPDFKKPLLREGQVFGQKAITQRGSIFCTNSKIEKKGQICGLFGSHGWVCQLDFHPNLKSHY